MSEEKRPDVGLATILKKDGLILIGERINSHGDGTLSFPGGHLKHFEEFLDCAIREMQEETGLIYKEDFDYLEEEPIAITNDFFEKENKHYITLFMEAIQLSQKQPIVMEPLKTKYWVYLPWENILKNKNRLFRPVQNLIKQGYHPFH